MCGSPRCIARTMIAQAAVGHAPWSWLVRSACILMMICMIGWLLLALAAIDFRTFRRVNVLHAALSLCGSLTVRIIYPGQQLEQLAMAAPGLAGCKGVAFAFCV